MNKDICYSIPEKDHSLMIRNICKAKRLFDVCSKINGATVWIDELIKSNVRLEFISLYRDCLLEGPSLRLDSTRGLFFMSLENLVDALQGIRTGGGICPNYTVKSDVSDLIVGEMRSLLEEFKHIAINLDGLQRARFSVSLDNGIIIFNGLATDSVDIDGRDITFRMRKMYGDDGNEEFSMTYSCFSVLNSKVKHICWPGLYRQDVPGVFVQDNSLVVSPTLLSLSANDVGILEPLGLDEADTEILERLGFSKEEMDRLLEDKRFKGNNFDLILKEDGRVWFCNDRAEISLVDVMKEIEVLNEDEIVHEEVSQKSYLGI